MNNREHTKHIMNNIIIGSKVQYQIHKYSKLYEGIITSIEECGCQSGEDTICNSICIGVIGINGNKPDCQIIPTNECHIKKILIEDFIKEDEFKV